MTTPPAVSSSRRERYGALLAFVLLLLYVGTVLFLINDVFGWFPQLQITEGLTYVHSTVAGLVSALVVAQLTVTDPGHNPAMRWLAEDDPARAKKWFPYIVNAYLLAWALTGLVALIIGTMLFPEANELLANTGTNWLGTAVIAGGVYLGVKP